MEANGQGGRSPGNVEESWYLTVVGRMMKSSCEGLLKQNQAVSYTCGGKEGTCLDHDMTLCIHVG